MHKLVALLILTFMATLQPVEAQTGSTFLENCTLAIRQSDGEKLTGLELLKAASCTSYVSGFLDAAGMIHSVRPQTRIVCVPESGITNDQGIRILVKHLRSSPETLHESARMSLLVALAKAFPCTK